ESLLTQTVLRNMKHLTGRPDQGIVSGRFRSGGRDILKFERHHVHTGGELAHTVQIFVGRVDLHIRHLTGRSIAIR
ncbi:MAG: hypothetical protein QOJ99_510, partial [Bryobacterales bacterium]|nr:hypothetical protein [Bryobacterales bacterium]